MIRMIPKSSEAQNAMRKCVSPTSERRKKFATSSIDSFLAVCVAGNQNLTAAKDLS